MAVIIVSKAPIKQAISGFWWIPPTSAIYKTELVRSDGTLDDVTNIILDGTEVTGGTTETTGIFTLKIDNSTGNYTDKWVAGNTFNYYKDYGSSAITKRFKGKIDRVSGSLTDQYIITITGRVSYANLREINVTKSYVGIETSVIIDDLFETYSDTYDRTDTTVFKTTTTNQTVAFQGKPFWDCVVEVATAASMDIYIDPTDKVHLIPQNSVTNTTDAIVEGQNLIAVGEFGLQTDEVRNKIRIYGAEINGVPLVWTEQDAASQASYGVKSYEESNTNLETLADVQAYAAFILSQKKDPPAIGKVTSYILCTLQPAELLKISNQINGFKSSYRIVSFTDFLGHTDMPKTEVTVNRDPFLVPKLFKQRHQSEQNVRDLKNRFDMDYSRVFLFDDETDTSTHSNTVISNSVLYWTGIGANGIWTSNVFSSATSIASFEVKATGNNIPNNATFEVSGDNGVSFNTASLDTQYTVNSGTHLILRITFSNSTANIDTCSILYKA